MGGKTSQSSQSVSIPPEVLARYNSVNARAEQVAQTPFQPYTDQFVAGLTPTQTAGIQNTSTSATQAQPYYNAATGLTLSGAQDVGALTQNQIDYYQNPYTQAVAAPTLQALQQQQGQERSQQQAQAIKSGAAFGERSGLQRAQLAGQQNLATAQAIAPIYQQGYQQAVQTAQGQQGVVAADLARRMQAGQQVAGIGTQAQQAGLQGAQAQIAAGTVEQQTQQADLTAKYQQFLQQRGYDFQTAQFLANIAMGTGALSGSTTTTTQPQGFFSDERLKHDARRIGETDDGLPIYSYKYNGDNKTQIGLMAQDVEKRKPEAVGLAPASDGKMYKTVDYDKATRTNKDYGGGVMGGYDPSSMGGAVAPGLAGEGFADGGMPGMPNMGGMPGVSSYVPAPNLPIGKLMMADPKLLQQNKAGLGSTVETGKNIAGLYDMGKSGIAWGKKQLFANGGLIVPRHGYATDGSVDDNEPTPYNYAETKAGEDPMKDVLSSGSKLVNSLPKPGGGVGGSGGPQSGASQVSSALGLGKAAMEFGEEVPEFMAMFLAQGGRTPFAYGGLIPRQHHADGERVIANDIQDSDSVVSADGGGGDEPTYKIAPQRKEEMEPHWQQFINRTYSGEGGMDENGKPRYNIRQGGKETFNPEEGHPGPGKPMGGESSAAGAGQFIHGTWNRITGGAPMTEGYQDAATKELAMQDYKARTGRDLDADLKEQGLSPQILKTLSPTWTSFNQGLSPPSMIGRSERAPSTYSGKGAGEASLGDVVSEYLPQGTPTSANFWVPALAGLGSMLASKNQTLLGAVGEGLVGGVSGYQAQQKQQMEMARDLRTMLDQRFTAGTIPGDSKQYGENAGKPGYFDTNLRTWLTVDQMIKGKAGIAGSLGIAPALLGVPELPKLPSLTSQKSQQDNKPQTEKTTQATETTVSGPAQEKPQTKVEEAAAPGDIYELSTTQLADRIRQGGDKAYKEAGLVGALDPRPIEKRMADNQRELDNVAQLPDTWSQKRAGELRTLLTTDSDTVAKLYDRATNLQSEKNKKEAENQMAQHNTHMVDLTKRMAGYQEGEKALLSLANIYKDYEAGRSSNLTAALKSWATAVGFGKDLPPGFDTMSNDAASKIVTKMGTDYMVRNALLRAPAAIDRTTQKMTPGPTLDPGAVFILMGNQLGELKRQNVEDTLYSDSNTRNVNKFIRNFNDDKTKNLDVFVASAMSELPVPKGVTQQELSKLSRDYHFVPLGQDPHQLGKVQENRKLGLGKVLVPTKDGKPVELYYKLDRGQ